MMQILSALFGFAAPFLPELFKYLQRKQDAKHEIDILSLQMQKSAAEAAWRLEEISAQADVAEATALHMPQQSFGIQILDAGTKWTSKGWILPVFYLFAILDFVAGMVRPGITYAAFGFYAFVKYSQIELAMATAGSLTMAALQVWGDADQAIVVMVLSYWFGHRAAKAAFGGSASTTTRGS
jgi:hypothetical protein